MHVLTICKLLLFLEGILLSNFSPLILINSAKTASLCFQYASAFILSLSLVWFADKSRKIGLTLIICITFSTFLKILNNSIPYGELIYIFCTCVIIPLTSAFTMMQLVSVQEQEKFSLQFGWLIVGRKARSLMADMVGDSFKAYEMWIDIFVTILFVLAAGSISFIQERAWKLQSINGRRPEQVYTPISRLLSEQRYFIFLLAVFLSSFLSFFTKKFVGPGSPSGSGPSPPNFKAEIAACLFSYFVAPHRIAPQAFFLLGQFLMGFRYMTLVKSISFPGSDDILGLMFDFGFIVTAIANAHIIVTFSKPGLEFTTCAIVDVVKTGLAPVFFVLVVPFLSVETSCLACIIILIALSVKYKIFDYSHDKLIKIKN